VATVAEKYEAFISALVYDEAGKGDAAQSRLRLAAIKPFPMFQINDEARTLAEKIISKKAIPEQYPEDALHVALAAINGADIIVTWNFTHLRVPLKINQKNRYTS
jgi:predicted nucleic acid-binding protein